MPANKVETFYPTSIKAWRNWLQKHHASKQSVWLIHYKKNSGKPSISWSEAVDEAICFGWIDSTRKTLDDERYIQFFGKRKPSSVWSKINKEKVQRLTDAGLMTAAGQANIDTARLNGSWNTLDEVEAGEIPKDLLQVFKLHPGAKKYFTGLSRSAQKAILQWLHLAKQPATRQKRMKEIAALAAQKLKPKQFR